MRRFALTLAAVFIFVALAGPATAAPIVFRFAGQSPPEHMATKTMEAMAKEIKEGPDGRGRDKDLSGRTAWKLYARYGRDDARNRRHGLYVACDGLRPAPRNDIRQRLRYGDTIPLKRLLLQARGVPTKLNEFLNSVGVHLIGSYVEGFIGIASTKPLIEPLNPKVDKGVLTRVPNMVSYMTGAQGYGLPSRLRFRIPTFTSRCRPASATRLTAIRRPPPTRYSATSSNTGTRRTTRWNTSA